MQEKGRLFTIGCSYTCYNWPTYADFLGAHFKEYYNLGKTGCGNQYIFNTLANVIKLEDLKPEDCLIVQFTSVARYDTVKKGLWGGGAGNIYNQDLYTAEWVQDHVSLEYNAVELHSYIEIVNKLFESLPCKTQLLWMLNPTIDTFLGEPYNNYWRLDLNKEDYKNALSFLKSHTKTFSKGFLDDGLALFQIDYDTPMYYRGQLDTHPNTTSHILYAEKIKEHLYPELPKFSQEYYDLAKTWDISKSSLETAKDNDSADTIGYPSKATFYSVHFNNHVLI